MARRLALAVLLPLALLALWATAVQQRWVVEGIVPSPAQVARSWYQWIVGGPTRSLSPYSGTWLANVAYSGRRVLEGFVLAAVVGIPLGLFIGWNRLVARLVDPSVQLLRPVPITAWLPFAIAVFGIYDASALFLIGLGAFYPIVVNTTHGVRDTNLLLLRAARMLGAGEAAILTKVVFRSALPSIFTGLRLGIGIAWTAVIVAEMIAVKSGLGYVLWDAYYVGRMDICVATMFSVGLLGFLSDRALQLRREVVHRRRRCRGSAWPSSATSSRRFSDRPAAASRRCSTWWRASTRRRAAGCCSTAGRSAPPTRGAPSCSRSRRSFPGTRCSTTSPSVSGPGGSRRACGAPRSTRSSSSWGCAASSRTIRPSCRAA
ncbi:MAG: ABC transporter permease [Candidatus Rokuibacteriota bacterium]|nr:MAG: ABC transporter permease [Candidatus Rokubacteria bacterium]